MVPRTPARPGNDTKGLNQVARTHYVTKSRKAQGNCMSPTCRHESKAIPEGSAYKWFSIRAAKVGRGQRKTYHTDCNVPPSHRTTSWQLGTIYDGQADAENAIPTEAEDDYSTLEAIANEFADRVQEAADGYRE